MTSHESLKLSLLENSHAFLKEAVVKAHLATSDTRQWQFAILNLVQSLELSLKAALNAIHPALVYDNLDNPKNTVSPMQALQRLAHPKIGGGIPVSEDDRSRIQRAVEVRNQMTHSEFELTGEYAAAKFFELFAFVADFQRQHLGTTVADILPPLEFESLIQVRKLLDELVLRAQARLIEEKIHSDFIWACPNCGEETFVIEDGTDACYVCSHSEPVVLCPQCSQPAYEESIESFFGALDTDYDEGRTVVLNSYGYDEFHACQDCLPEIRREIQTRREQDEFHRLEEEYYARRTTN